LGVILVVAVLAGFGVASPSLGIVRFHVRFFRTKDPSLAPNIGDEIANDTRRREP